MTRHNLDIIGELDKVLQALGLERDKAVSDIVVTGADPILPSTVRLGSAIGVSLLAAAVGAAQIWHAHTGRSQRLELDLAEAVHQLTPYLGGGNTINGYSSNMGSLLGIDGRPAAAIWDFYRTADGRWVIPTACYPKVVEAFLALLGTAHDREHIAAAIAGWNAYELEEAAAVAGVPLTVVRSREEFLAHPQGRAVLAEPLVAVERVGDAPPRPLPGGAQPLSGLRSLNFTHIFAGTATGRALAEHGADVLHVCEPDAFEHDLCWNETAVGLRSTRLALQRGTDGRAHFEQLLQGADVFVHNHRASKMRRLGFSPQECAEISPGLVHVSARCYGHSGPWQDRGGFDHHAQSFVGINHSEGGDDAPKLPPGRMLNDYVAANLAAAGTMAALLRRAEEGGSYSVRISLAGTANWTWEMGAIDRDALAALGSEVELPAASRVTHDTPLGEFAHVVPPVRFEETTAVWRDPVMVARGSSLPRWLSA
jgi:crotonobetainyl-CoA:carnitine CoA-transferase CaiB-like acyl-CoA transferase